VAAGMRNDGEENEENRFYISHRFCDEKEKIKRRNYVFCHRPKYPVFYDLDGRDEL